MADFIATLLDMRSGSAVAECSEKLAQVIKAVCETGKKGRIAVEISIAPSKIALGEVKEVELTHDVKILEPRHDAGKTIFFPLKDGTLSRQDPTQIELDLREEERNRTQ